MSEIDSSSLSPIRKYLESCWADWKSRNWSEERQKHSPLSASMCRLSSVFVVELMHRAGHKEWKVAGGYAKPTMFDTDVIRSARIPGHSGGFRDAGGRFHDHNWATDGLHIIDFTADQFGYAPAILVVPETDERFVPNFKSLRHTRIDCDSALLWARTPEADVLRSSAVEFLLNMNNEIALDANVPHFEP
ncbi:hypothetical protein [Acetobacter pasteurianus]|uniref:Uncharacterized protein n=1 Tax=Acetobacter pasteurianus NBRC 3188 TaxID=1226663 RepID=A0A401WW54_ACEPA|nr:hypothetical protein [Acetobacter pasteurianus]GCD53592.1 hypothetical protein NBRC3188_2289 [Acetobacter pasteurianus NBRC 3188]